jgi:hypothetical protein
MELKTRRLRSCKKCTYVNTFNYLHAGTSHLLSISWNPKVAFRVQRSLPLDLVRSQPDKANPLPHPLPNLFKVSFNIIIQGTPNFVQYFPLCVYPYSCPTEVLYTFLKTDCSIRNWNTSLWNAQSSLFLNKHVSIVTRKLTAGIMVLSLLQFHCCTDQTQLFIAGGFQF